MAWRIDEQVIRGEIDCRVRGRVTGRIWMSGADAPVELELEGCPWRDLAGRTLSFVNPHPKPPLAHGTLARRQTGVVGDLTASNKRKIPDIPIEEVGEYYARRQPFPWHWANTIYLEWFSECNGRVVIETADFTIDVSIEATWSMTEAEDEAQRRENGKAMTRFLERLAEAAGLAPDEDEPTDD